MPYISGREAARVVIIAAALLVRGVAAADAHAGTPGSQLEALRGPLRLEHQRVTWFERRSRSCARHSRSLHTNGRRVCRRIRYAAGPHAPTPTSSTPRASFVTANGTQLMLDGRPYRFTGLNYYNANSRNNCWYTPGDLDKDLTDWGPGEEVMRAWFFQDLATTNGARDWAAFDHTLAIARRHGIKVIATLTGQWGDCEEDSAYKGESWYASRYKARSAASGVPASYRDYVAEIVARYNDDPTILMWQLVNEAEDATSVSGSCTSTATATLKAFAADVGGLIKSLDPNHLVSLGTMGGGQCGAQGEEYKMLHEVASVDLCEYHDYGAPLDPMPGDEWNGLQRRITQCDELGKPLFVGETGITASSVGGLDARAHAFQPKLAAQFQAGVVGALPWAWVDAAHRASSPKDDYSIASGDPVLSVLAGL